MQRVPLRKIEAAQSPNHPQYRNYSILFLIYDSVAADLREVCVQLLQSKLGVWGGGGKPFQRTVLIPTNLHLCVRVMRLNVC